MRVSTRPRLVVLGLDGLPFSLARDLQAQGLLPHLAVCFQTPSPLAQDPDAAPRPLRSELPELSPVNWTSFFTAAGPETHGIFGFTRISGSTYAISLADSTQVLAPTLFDLMGQAGRVSRVINLPNTYPARPIKGMLVAGFPAANLAAAVYPPPLLGPLAAAGYRLDADTAGRGHDPELLLADLHAVLASRRRALDLLWPDLAWDLFVFVLTETDRLFHFLYPAVESPGHPLHADCMAFFSAWDRLIGEVLERYQALPEPKRLLILADHGFTSLTAEVDVNVWLMQHGYLDLAPAREPAGELDATRILPSSAAFALDPGRIYLHTRQRFARGRLSQGDAAALCREIQAGLLALTHAGNPVMQQVFTADELYGPGPGRDLAPDMVCLPARGYDLKAKFDRSELFCKLHRHGTHTADNAFFFDSLGARPERVRDVGALIPEFFALNSRALVPA